MISSSYVCLYYSLNIYTLSVELFVCQSSKRGKLLNNLSKQSLLLVVLMVTNEHNYELSMCASPMKYSGTLTVNKIHLVVAYDTLGIGTRKSNTH